MDSERRLRESIMARERVRAAVMDIDERPDGDKGALLAAFLCAAWPSRAAQWQ